MLHRADHAVGQDGREAEVDQALGGGVLHLPGLLHGIDAAERCPDGLQQPVVLDVLVHRQHLLRPDRHVELALVGAVGAALADHRHKGGRLDLGQRRARLRGVLSRVHVELVGAVRDGRAPVGVLVGAQVLHVGQYADDEQAVDHRSQGSDDVGGRLLPFPFQLQGGGVELGREHPPGRFPYLHQITSILLRRASASLLTSGVANLASVTVIDSP